MSSEITNEQIRLALQFALFDEVYPEIRMIVFQFDRKKKIFRLRYYLSREPNNDDYDNLGRVMTIFISNFKFSEFDSLKEECIYSLEPISKLETFDGIIYSRKEMFN